MAAAAGGARSRIRSRHEGPGISSRILASRGSVGADIWILLWCWLHPHNWGVIRWLYTVETLNGGTNYILSTQTSHLRQLQTFSLWERRPDPRKPVPVCLTSTVLNIELREILRIYYWHNGSLILCGDVAIVAGSWQRRWRDSRMTGVIASGSGLCQDTSPGQYRSHHRQQVRYLKQYHQPVPNRRTRRQSLIIGSSLIVFITRSCINIL